MPESGRTDVFAADGVIGPDLAAVDWVNTPLGPPASWPQSLRTAVDILLSSRFPMWLAWGPELTFCCNGAYRRDTLGRKYPWALGRPAAEVWAEIWDDIGPRIDTVLTTGEATWDEALLLFLERSGYQEETYHTFSYSPLRDDAGAVVGMLCVVSEDTDRVVGERRMATLRDLGSDPTGVRTEQEALAFACEQLNRNLRDLPFTLTYLFRADGSAQLAGSSGGADELPVDWPLAELARDESVLVALDDIGLPAGDWTEPPRTALVVPLRRQGGSPYGFLVAGLDRYRPADEGYRGFVELVAGHLAAGVAAARGYRTQQRRAEELAELDQAKTAFFSNISHEFRTPLTLIMGPVADLRDQFTDGPAPVREELDVIHRNGLRLGKLVNTLLDFSRIEAGRMQAGYEPVDLGAITAELASVFRSAIDKAGLAFVVDSPTLPEPVYIDRGMWEKVVLNLLSNALKFTFDGSIEVRLRTENGAAELTIADTGIGVSAEEMPRLFERFHRIPNARARSHEGSGIGLALVRELVGLHGGTIVADSTVGAGTRFTIRLPFGSAHLPADALADATGSAAVSVAVEPYVHEALRWLPGEQSPQETPPTTLPEGMPAPAIRASVIVADDNADMRGYLTRLLSGAGYQVSAVADGAQALDAIRTHAPDLLVCDVMMPKLDGLGLVAALRQQPRTAALPVVLLSARAGEEASIEGLRVGADDYLVKPFAAAELLARVRANIELSRLRGHHSRWRAALVDSLQEAFFVCDEDGAVVEINAAFTDILGYGADGLPYPPPHPWWPDERTDPESPRQVVEAFAGMLPGGRSGVVIPVLHHDGSRRWISATANSVQDPDTGRTVVVGTFRDATAEHYVVRRETALAALSTSLSRAASLPEALTGALAELRELWRARRVLAAVFSSTGPPELTSVGSHVTWADMPQEHRDTINAVRERPTLSPAGEGTTGIGVALEHPAGTMVLWLDLDERRPLTDQDELLLSLLAGHLAQGLSRAHQIDQHRETALALQRAILGPADLPDGFAVGYEPAARPLQVGGDWYDTVPLPDGRIGIVVGDCVGRGLAAAAVMGQLRSACRALLLQQASPARTLMALDNFAAGVPGALCTTVFCGVLDPDTGTLTYSSAGHPPAILTGADGSRKLLDEANYIPLAVRPETRRPEAQWTLPPHATLLMYTDGLVERRRRSLTDGIDAASEAVRVSRHIALDDLVTAVMARLAPPEGYEDDVALLLYRHPAPLELTFPAESSRLAAVRKSLRDWLTKCELPTQTMQNALVAVGEACANAIEHGSDHTAGAAVRLRAEALVDDLHLTVSDSGSWRPPRPDEAPTRGRGLTLIRALTEDVTITRGRHGTVVDMRMGIS
ncbi:MAG TPA: SpoIIE family protein phosphatase [Pseudonocardiaceae bacterium]